MSATSHPTPARPATPPRQSAKPRISPVHIDKSYPLWFFLPGGIVFIALFIVPTVLSFYFAFTRWTLFKATFVGSSTTSSRSFSASSASSAHSSTPSSTPS